MYISCIVGPVLGDNVRQNISLGFRMGGCLLLG